MERLGEARIVRRLVTICTRRGRARKLRQVWCRFQIRHRRCMTYGTGAAVDAGDDLACMTACCTISVNGDRLIRQPTRRVRCMVVVTMDIRRDLLGMTV